MPPSGSSPSLLPSSPCAWFSTSLTCCSVRYNLTHCTTFYWEYTESDLVYIVQSPMRGSSTFLNDERSSKEVERKVIAGREGVAEVTGK